LMNFCYHDFFSIGYIDGCMRHALAWHITGSPRLFYFYRWCFIHQIL